MSCEHCRGYSVSYCPVCGDEVTKMVTCPECEGSGLGKHYAFDRIKRIDVECTEIAYNLLPEDEDEAEALGQRYCKQDVEYCWRCRGEGEIPEYEIGI